VTPAELAREIASELDLDADDAARLFEIAGRPREAIRTEAERLLTKSGELGQGRLGRLAGAAVALDDGLDDDTVLASLPDDEARAAHRARHEAKGGLQGVGGLDPFDEDEATAADPVAVAKSEAWLAREDALLAAKKAWAGARTTRDREAAAAEIEKLRKAP